MLRVTRNLNVHFMVQFKILYMLLIMYRAENGQHLRPKPRQRVCSMCRTSCVLGLAEITCCSIAGIVVYCITGCHQSLIGIVPRLTDRRMVAQRPTCFTSNGWQHIRTRFHGLGLITLHLTLLSSFGISCNIIPHKIPKECRSNFTAAETGNHAY
jgi:hypothetical protein